VGLRLAPLDTSVDSHLQIKEVVYRRLVRAIVELELEPGRQLRERQLAEQMGVSQTPIPQALVRPEKEGPVPLAQDGGRRHLSARHPERGDPLLDLAARTSLLPQAAHGLVRGIELRELLNGGLRPPRGPVRGEAAPADHSLRVRRSRALLDQGTTDEIPALFDEFDRILYRQAAGHRIGGLLVELDLHLERLGNLTVGVPGRLDASVRQHEEIVTAITKRDPGAAEAACREHIRSVFADLINALPEQLTRTPTA